MLSRAGAREEAAGGTTGGAGRLNGHGPLIVRESTGAAWCWTGARDSDAGDRASRRAAGQGDMVEDH
jgi:hypothetical protein